jgi:uncharacterized metal-binding protein YceD (DUF177 family)
MSAMDEKIIIDIARLNPEGETIVGEVDAVDLDEEFVKPFGGIRYKLTVRLYGKELLVKGAIEQDFDLVCSRCGKDFDDTIKVADYLFSQEVGDDTVEVDLTESLRESIILALPTYPVCDEACPGIEQTEEMPGDDRWGALDQLKV